MIVSIFKQASKSQRLNNLTIEKLLKCIVSFSDLCKLINFEETKLVDDFLLRIKAPDAFYELIKLKEPKMLSSFLENLVSKTIDCKWFFILSYVKLKDFNKPEVETLIKNEINQIRLDSIETIYNCVLVDKTILTKSRINKLEECLQDELLRSKIIKIFELLDSTDLFDHKKLFNEFLTELKRNSNVQQSLNYILDQSKDMQRCKQLFDSSVLNGLFELIESNSLDSTNTTYLVEIVLNCVENVATVNLSPAQLDILINLIEKETVQYETKNVCLLVILNVLQKQKTMSNSIVDKLVKNMDSNLNEYQSNLTLVYLFKNIFSESIYLKDVTLLEKISSKLSDQKRVVENEKEILFETMLDSNSASPSVACLAANVLFYSIKNQVTLSDRLASNIIAGLDNEDKQARILSAH